MLPIFGLSRGHSFVVYFFIVYLASLSVFCLVLPTSASLQRNCKVSLVAMGLLPCTDRKSYIFVLISSPFLPWQETRASASLCLRLGLKLYSWRFRA